MAFGRKLQLTVLFHHFKSFPPAVATATAWLVSDHRHARRGLERRCSRPVPLRAAVFPARHFRLLLVPEEEEEYSLSGGCAARPSAASSALRPVTPPGWQRLRRRQVRAGPGLWRALVPGLGLGRAAPAGLRIALRSLREGGRARGLFLVTPKGPGVWRGPGASCGRSACLPPFLHNAGRAPCGAVPRKRWSWGGSWELVRW